MSLNYTKKTVNNFLHPKNIGSIKNPDGYAQIGNMICGDQLDFYLKVEKGRIKNVKFLSFGCASNIATASILTEEVKGMTVAQAKKATWKKIVKELGGLPRQKFHCSVMAVEGLQKAIENYEKKEVKRNKKKELRKNKVKPKKTKERAPGKQTLIVKTKLKKVVKRNKKIANKKTLPI